MKNYRLCSWIKLVIVCVVLMNYCHLYSMSKDKLPLWTRGMMSTEANTEDFLLSEEFDIDEIQAKYPHPESQYDFEEHESLPSLEPMRKTKLLLKLLKFIENIKIDKPLEYLDVQIYPLSFKEKTQSSFILFDKNAALKADEQEQNTKIVMVIKPVVKAFEEGTVVIEDTGKLGSLCWVNKSDDYILLTNIEQLWGMKIETTDGDWLDRAGAILQPKLTAATALIGPHETYRSPSFCNHSFRTTGAAGVTYNKSNAIVGISTNPQTLANVMMSRVNRKFSYKDSQMLLWDMVEKEIARTDPESTFKKPMEIGSFNSMKLKSATSSWTKGVAKKFVEKAAVLKITDTIGAIYALEGEPVMLSIWTDPTLFWSYFQSDLKSVEKLLSSKKASQKLRKTRHKSVDVIDGSGSRRYGMAREELKLLLTCSTIGPHDLFKTNKRTENLNGISNYGASTTVFVNNEILNHRMYMIDYPKVTRIIGFGDSYNKKYEADLLYQGMVYPVEKEDTIPFILKVLDITPEHVVVLHYLLDKKLILKLEKKPELESPGAVSFPEK